jgi:hypothetical protein
VYDPLLREVVRTEIDLRQELWVSHFDKIFQNGKFILGTLNLKLKMRE